MSKQHLAPLAPATAQRPLKKQNSWSPDVHREEAWLRRKESNVRRMKSVTDDDLEELKGCIELGFGFYSTGTDPRLSDTLPALGLYHAVNRQYQRSMSRSSSTASFTSSSSDDIDGDSTGSFYDPGECNRFFFSF